MDHPFFDVPISSRISSYALKFCYKCDRSVALQMRFTDMAKVLLVILQMLIIIIVLVTIAG